MTTKTDTMEIGTDVLLTVSTGRMLCDSFGSVQQVGDFLTGEPTFTHMYASQSFADRLAKELRRQHPWLADEDKIFADYPDLDELEKDDKGPAIMAWLDEHVYPTYGRNVIIEPEAEHVHVPFTTGLENLGKNRRS